MQKYDLWQRILFFLLVLVALTGCSPDDGGAPKSNQPPETFILEVPPAGTPVPHDGLISWNGSDPDGVVLGYFWRIVYTDLSGDRIESPWQFTSEASARINLYAPDTLQHYSTEFWVTAVDQAGNGVYDDVVFPENIGNASYPEPFNDVNGNGVWDNDIPEPWTDNDEDGEADPGEFVDINDNEYWDDHIAENFTDLGAIDLTPAYRSYLADNHPPTLTVTTQPAAWTGGDTSLDPKFCLSGKSRIWRGLGFFWIGQDVDDATFPLSFKWRLEKRSTNEMVRQTRDWLSAAMDTPFNSNVIFTAEPDSTFNQRGSRFIYYGSDIVEKGADGGRILSTDYRLIVWARDASWGLSLPDSTDFSVIIPVWDDPVLGKDVLIIDETKHNDIWLGINVFNDQLIDEYYSNLFTQLGLTFDQWEYSNGTETPPSKYDLSQYKTVFWHSDDQNQKLHDYVTPNPVKEFDRILVEYMGVGGNIILSGYKLLQAFPRVGGANSAIFGSSDTEFNYFHISEFRLDTAQNMSAGQFVGAISRDPAFPSLELDSLKIAAIDNRLPGDPINALPGVSIYKPLFIYQDPYDYRVFYGYDAEPPANNPVFENPDDVCAMAFKNDTFNAVLIGFPLFLMDNSDNQVRDMLQQTFNYINEPFVPHE